MNVMQQLERSWKVEDAMKGVAEVLSCDWRQVPQAIEKQQEKLAELMAEKQRLEAILSDHEEGAQHG